VKRQESLRRRTACWEAGIAWAAALALAGGTSGAAAYSVNGKLTPPGRAAVSLHGSTSPFQASTMADERGRFVFRGLEAGTYTVVIFVPGAGEGRRTIEVGPGTADRRGRVNLELDLEALHLSAEALRQAGRVTAGELRVGEKARREYEEAQKKLGRRDVEGAIAHLERALEVSPEFVAAWNQLGTIAYQTGKYKAAERYFRSALERDNQAYEPLVNLGGVLLTLGAVDEALEYNLAAVLSRPGDALANSQMGLSYFLAGNLELARRYLRQAKKLDPAHFSHPQLTLAEIAMRLNEKAEAVAELEDFLKRHPDAENAGRIRAGIEKLKE
jgi:tetratricopeptide (TPR) repeat protein